MILGEVEEEVGGEREDEEDVDQAHARKHLHGPSPRDEGCNDRVVHDVGGGAPGKLEDVLQDPDIPDVVLHEVPVVDGGPVVLVVGVVMGCADAGVQLLQHDLVAVGDAGQEFVNQGPPILQKGWIYRNYILCNNDSKNSRFQQNPKWFYILCTVRFIYL